jgi:hypothetical protein
MKAIRRASCLSVFGLFACAASVLAGAAEVAVTTYHYNIQRTGWNQQETTLSASAFPANFGIITTVPLDDQVDTQPLLVPGETIAGGVHDVLYVTTEGNTVYALDANTGQVLLTRNLGTSVNMAKLNGCGNNGPNVGINGTPVIDLARQHLYVIAFVDGSPPTYQLHALNLLTLTDDIPPVTVSAAHTLTDGTTFNFNATYQRQRPALLEFKGTIYAGFGSFCDFNANDSRGWVLGWTAKTLKPLASNQLNDTQATSPTSFFLSSVWMSGFGLASNGTNIYFSTGNSDCNFYTDDCTSKPGTYDGVTNIQESVIGIEPSLATRTGVFTPSNVYDMDVADADLGAAGVLLMPPLGKSGIELAAIVSKDGRLWLLNQNNLGTDVQETQLGKGCWCGPSYFRGADNHPRLITSAGSLQTWTVNVSATTAGLALESTTSTIPVGQDPGFFTSVSSNGHTAGSAIIWAVGRPTSSTNDVLTLYAFNAAPSGGTLPLLYSATAGNWPNLNGNANIVPMVANGKVYVGSYKAMTIFGPGGTAAPAAAIAPIDPPLADNMNRVTGTLIEMDHTQLTLLTRTGEKVAVDASGAVARQRSTKLVLGEPLTAVGPTRSGEALWKVTAIMRAKPGQGAWPSDH